MRVAVTGASGFLGESLVRRLTELGHVVLSVGRPKRSGPGPDVIWEPARGIIDARALEGVDAAVHLAGEPIAQRWTAAAMQRIRDSRVQGTQLFASTLAALPVPPRLLISMSAVGYYGDRGDEELVEGSARGTGFLAETAEAWEGAADPARAAGIRVVHPRLGIVLHRDGGALAKLLPIFSLGAGGRIASGRQWMSWISRADAIDALVFMLDNGKLDGPVNLTAPSPVRNATFTETLGRVLRRPTLAAVPGFAVKMLYGEMGAQTVIAGQKVLPAKLTAAGFRFSHPGLREALADAVA